MNRWTGGLLAAATGLAWIATGPAGRAWIDRATGAGPGVEPVASAGVAAERVVAEGRVVAYPGAEVVVGTEAAGRIVRLEVAEKSVVRRGQVIAELNAADLVAARGEAEAQRAVSESDLRHATREIEREQALLNRRAGTPQKVDEWRHQVEMARARIRLAEASVRRLDALIDESTIVAPIDGVVTARHVDAGETVEVAAAIVTIVDLSRLRIEAEVDELDIPRVSLGAGVEVAAEGYAARWPGSVEELPDAVTGRRMRPEDPGRPIDARVLPVKVALSAATPLKLGQRVDLSIAAGPLAPSLARRDGWRR